MREMMQKERYSATYMTEDGKSCIIGFGNSILDTYKMALYVLADGEDDECKTILIHEGSRLVAHMEVA